MIKAVLLDFDETLIQNIQVKTRALKYTAKKYYNLTFTDEEIRKLWNRPFSEFMKTLFKDIDTLENIIKIYTLEREKFPARAYAHTVPALKKLSKQYVLGIITSHTQRYIKKDLALARIPADLFCFIQTEEETAVHKPDPHVFDPALLMLDKRNINRSEVVYVGDQLVDYHAARDAGMDFYGLADRTTSEAKFQRNGAKTIHSLNELHHLLTPPRHFAKHTSL